MEKIIYVIDDSDTNLSTAENALEDFYTVVTVPSGKRAIELLEKIIPQLILLDIEMPEMNGFQVLEYLRASKYSNIPVMFLTATIDDEIKARALQMGVVDFITKPFSKPALLDKIRLYIND